MMNRSVQVEVRGLLDAACQEEPLGSHFEALAANAAIPAQVIGNEAFLYGSVDQIDGEDNFRLPPDAAARIALIAAGYALTQPEEPDVLYSDRLSRETDAGQVIAAIQYRLPRRTFREVTTAVLRETVVQAPELHAGVRFMVKQAGGPITKFLIRDAASMPGPALPESPLLDYLAEQLKQRGEQGEVIDMSWLGSRLDRASDPSKASWEDLPQEFLIPVAKNLGILALGVGASTAVAGKKGLGKLLKGSLNLGIKAGKGALNLAVDTFIGLFKS